MAPSALPRILIVDDQVLMLRSLARLLGDYETVVADSPSKAWALLRSGMHFDAVVCDVMMPELTGPELYVRCCQLVPDLAKRFVFTSADPIEAKIMIDESVAQVRARQAPPLLQKPTSRDRLVEAVSRVIADSPQRSGTYRMPFSGDGEQSRGSVSSQQKAAPQRQSSSGSRNSSY